MFVKLNDASTTRVNLNNVVAYTVVTTSGSEAINFELACATDAGAIVSLDVTYSGDTADEQVLADSKQLDSLYGKVLKASADQDA